MTSSDLGWEPYMKSWIQRYIKNKELLHQEAIDVLTDLFIAYIELGLARIENIKDQQPMAQCPI